MVAKAQLVNQTHLRSIENAYDREGMKIAYFSEAVGCETKTSFSSNKLTMASCCVSLNFSIWKRSNTHFTENSTLRRHVGKTSDRIDQSQGSLPDSSRPPSDWSRNTMGRPVIQTWCGARNAGSQNGWKSSLCVHAIEDTLSIRGRGSCIKRLTEI